MEVKQITPSRTLIEWHKKSKYIDMSPSYQRRGNLWTLNNKRLLINSILNGYDIPKIYLADFTYFDNKLNENEKMYAVIDGKQRLETIFSYINDDFFLNEKPVRFHGKIINLSGKKYSNLSQEHPDLADLLDNYALTIMGVITEDLEEIQELFIRLNLNVSISGPEKRNAMPGPIPPLLRELSVHSFFREYATFSINRGQDLNVAAMLLSMEIENDVVSTSKGSLDKLVSSNIKNKEEDFMAQRKRVLDNLGKLTSIFEPKNSLLNSQSLIPIYYWFIRNLNDNDISKFPKFLKEFEYLRKLNRKNDENANERLLAYSLAMRSPEDKKKKTMMINILTQYWNFYLGHSNLLADIQVLPVSGKMV